MPPIVAAALKLTLLVAANATAALMLLPALKTSVALPLALDISWPYALAVTLTPLVPLAFKPAAALAVAVMLACASLRDAIAPAHCGIIHALPAP
jgi:hypothetical protein